MQAWETKRPSKIVFSGLKGRTWNPEDGYGEDQTFNADVYVFCLQIEKDRGRWDALDLEQWRFYVLPRIAVQERNASSIGINSLSLLTGELSASELGETVRDCVS